MPLMWCIALTRLKSFGAIVCLCLCMAHKFVASKKLTRKVSTTPCSVSTAPLWNLRPFLKSCVISLINLPKGNRGISKATDFWNHQISHSATVPGLCLYGCLTPGGLPSDWFALWATLVGNALQGFFPPSLVFQNLADASFLAHLAASIPFCESPLLLWHF